MSWQQLLGKKKRLVEFTSEDIWAFFIGSFKITNSNSLFVVGLFRCPISSPVSVLQGIFPFHLGYKFVGITLFIVFLHDYS